MEYEIAIMDQGKLKVLETRDGPLPQEGEMVEVTIGDEDVELEVYEIAKVHKKAGVTHRVILDAGGVSGIPVSIG